MRILVAAGTSEAREVVRSLAEQGHDVTATVARGAAARALDGLGARVLAGRMDSAQFLALLRSGEYEAVVDASHPFAQGLHGALRDAARVAGTPFLRFERQGTELPADPHLHLTADVEGAARIASSFGGTIFLTTGIKDAEIFRLAAGAKGLRVVVRVLPEPESIAAVLQLGFRPEDVVALKGPFTDEVNAALFRHFAAHVLVTKESGPRGSVPQKIRPALALGMEVVVVQRPASPTADVVTTLEQLRSALDEICP